LYLRYTTPIYRATGAISFIDEGSNDRFDQIFKANSTDDIDAEIEVLRSASLMERVVKKANLHTNYYAIGKIKTLNIYKNCPFRLQILKIADSSHFFSMNVDFLNQHEFRINNEKQVFKTDQLFENVYGIFRILINENAGVGKEYTVTWTPARALATVYAGMVRVGPKVARSMIHYISMDVTNLTLGIDIINNLIEEYKKVNIEYRNTMTNQTLDFINVRLALLERDLDSVERRLLRFKQNNDIFDMDVQSRTYFDIISEADKSVNTERMNLKIVELIEEYLYDKNTKYEKLHT